MEDESWTFGGMIKGAALIIGGTLAAAAVLPFVGNILTSTFSAAGPLSANAGAAEQITNLANRALNGLGSGASAIGEALAGISSQGVNAVTAAVGSPTAYNYKEFISGTAQQQILMDAGSAAVNGAKNAAGYIQQNPAGAAALGIGGAVLGKWTGLTASRPVVVGPRSY